MLMRLIGLAFALTLATGLQLGPARSEDRKLWFQTHSQDTDSFIACQAAMVAAEHAGQAPTPWSEDVKRQYSNGMAVAFYVGTRAKDARIRTLSQRANAISPTPHDTRFERRLEMMRALTDYCAEGK